MAYETIQLTVGEVSRLTIDRPKKMNALNAQVLREIDAALDVLETHPEVRALIVTGAGEKAFVAGADIAEIAATDARSGEALARRGQALLARLEEAPYATLAAINGFALGGGLELAMACDLRLAARGARLGLPEVTLGLIPGYAGTQRLVRLVGQGRALELTLTGSMIDAERAERIGLVNHVHEAEELMEKTAEMAGRIAAAGPLAVARAKSLVHSAGDVTLARGCEAEAASFAILCSTEDKAEGTTAFLEKRPPTFTGR